MPEENDDRELSSAADPGNELAVDDGRNNDVRAAPDRGERAESASARRLRLQRELAELDAANPREDTRENSHRLVTTDGEQHDHPGTVSTHHYGEDGVLRRVTAVESIDPSV